MADESDKKPEEGSKPGEPAAEEKAAAPPDWAKQEPFVPSTPAPPARAASGTIEPRSDPSAAAQTKSTVGSTQVKDSAAAPPKGSAASERSKDTGQKTPQVSHLQSGGAGGGSGQFDDETDPGPRRRRYLGLTALGWLMVIAVGLAVLLLVFDIRNRDRFLMVCQPNSVELHRGCTFPWPFGHELMVGPQFQPVEIPTEADCPRRVFDSQEEAELGFLDFITGQVQLALANPGTADLGRARRQVQQALLLTRDRRSLRKAAQKMQAELAYREGRSGLARVENEVRTALARFQEAQRLDGERWEDLDQWISHLELLLRTVSPSPGGALPSSPFTAPPAGMGPVRPAPIPGLPTRLPSVPPTSAPAASPDGGPPSGGGILM